MHTPGEFFRKESDEYVSGMRALLGEPSPDRGEMRRLARALRGCAQMAREEGVYRGARILEAATRELAEGGLAWDERARGHVGATLDDLWSIIEAGEADAPQAEAVDHIAAIRARWEELGLALEEESFPGAAPPDARASTGPEAPPALREYAAREVRGVLAVVHEGIRALRADGKDREPLKKILLRQRALMGAAGLSALPAVSDPLQIMDEIARLAASQGRSVEGPWLEVFENARAALEEASVPLAAGEVPAGDTPTLERLRTLRERLVEGRAPEAADEEADEEIPVEVVNFFRTEARGRLEKLRKMADDMEGKPEAESDLRLQLREALTGLAQTAGTFGFVAVSREIDRAAARVGEIQAADAKVLVATLEGAIEAALARTEAGAPRATGMPAVPNLEGPVGTASAGAGPATQAATPAARQPTPAPEKPAPKAPAPAAPEQAPEPPRPAPGPPPASHEAPPAPPPAPERSGQAPASPFAPAPEPSSFFRPGSEESGAPSAAGPSTAGTGGAGGAGAAAGTTEPEPPHVPLQDLCYSGESALRRALALRSELEQALAQGRAQELLDEVFDLIRLGTT